MVAHEIQADDRVEIIRIGNCQVNGLNTGYVHRTRYVAEMVYVHDFIPPGVNLSLSYSFVHHTDVERI